MKNKIKLLFSGTVLIATFIIATPTTTLQAKPTYCLQAFVDCVQNLPWWAHVGGGTAGCAIGYLGCG